MIISHFIVTNRLTGEKHTVKTALEAQQLRETLDDKCGDYTTTIKPVYYSNNCFTLYSNNDDKGYYL
jgi:hypothetical protein